MLTLIAGDFRGKKLFLPNPAVVRPTSQRAKEALFSSLNAHFPKGFDVVVEPFAGTASFSLEALSRKIAKKALVFENNPSVLKTLEKNLALFKSPLPLEIIRKDATQIPFPFFGKALIFIDPPYSHPDLIRLAFEKLWKSCATKSVLICEAEKAENLPPNPTLTRQYGRAFFGFYTKGSEEIS